MCEGYDSHFVCLSVNLSVISSFWCSIFIYCVDFAENSLFVSFGIINFADAKLLDFPQATHNIEWIHLHTITASYIQQTQSPKWSLSHNWSHIIMLCNNISVLFLHSE